MAAAVPRVTFAPTTPFLDDGSLDLAGLERTVRWLRGQGVTSIIAGGTTGPRERRASARWGRAAADAHARWQVSSRQ